MDLDMALGSREGLDITVDQVAVQAIPHPQFCLSSQRTNCSMSSLTSFYHMLAFGMRHPIPEYFETRSHYLAQDRLKLTM